MTRTTPFIHRNSIAEEDIASALDLDEAAPLFLPDVHNINIVDHSAPWLNLHEPRIICAPLHQGKTTELNLIRTLFHRMPSSNGEVRLEIAEDLAKSSRAIPLDELQQLLAERLRSGSASPQLEVIISTAELLDGKHRVLMTLDGAENLSRQARDWLLESLEFLRAEERSLLKKKRLHIVVSGRFTSETLRENLEAGTRTVLDVSVDGFSAEHIEAISERLAKQRGVILTPGFINLMSEYVDGDKYLFQRLADATLDLARPSLRNGTVSLTQALLRKAIANFVSTGYRSDRLFSKMLSELSIDLASLDAISRILQEAVVRWVSLSSKVRSALVDLAIARSRDGDACFRNACVREVLEAALDRRAVCARFIADTLPDTVLLPSRERTRRSRISRSLETLAFRGSLLWLYYAEVTASDDSTLQILVEDPAGNTFEGSLLRSHFERSAPRDGEGMLMFGKRSSQGPISKVWYHNGS